MMFYSTQASTQNAQKLQNSQNAKNGWTASHLLQLQTGCNLRSPASGEKSGWGPRGYAGPYSESQEREMQACWDEHGDTIMAEYAATRPAQRPWFWWRQRDMELPEDERSTLKAMHELRGNE